MQVGNLALTCSMFQGPFVFSVNHLYMYKINSTILCQVWFLCVTGRKIKDGGMLGEM
jgi:hypothetical protein